MPVRTVANGLHSAVIQPGQEEQNNHAAAHGDHAPELGINGQHHGHHTQRHHSDGAFEYGGHFDFGHRQVGANQYASNQGVHHFVGDSAQHGVKRREVPDGGNVQGRLERIGRNEVVVLQEIAAHFRCKKHNRGENHQEDADRKNVMHSVVRMKRNAIQGTTLGVLGGLDFHAVRVVGTHFMQGNNVRHHQAEQHQRHRNDVEAEEAVERGITHHEVTADEQGQVGANERNGGEQVNDHLSAPVAHLTPRQQIAHESFCHQSQENATAKQPDQFAWLAVATVNQSTEHVEINHHKESGGTGGMHIANQPAPRDVAHDVFHRSKRQGGIGFVMHHQENTGHDLDHQHQQGQRAENVKNIEVFGRVVLAHVLFEELRRRKPVVHPVEQFF